MPSQKVSCSTAKPNENAVFLNRTKAHIRRTTQKLRRTMITTADWPPPRVIFNTEVTTPRDDNDHHSSNWLLPCCFQRCRSKSPEVEDHKNSNLSKMLMGTYKNGTQVKNKKLLLRTGADGSLICPDNVDVNMLIEGFREFERRFQYGTLMPFANVLPPVNPVRSDYGREEIPGIREEDEEEECRELAESSTLKKSSDCNNSSNRNVIFKDDSDDQKRVVIVESICEA
ncbi:unnamed protein product [Hymenolepis diminuta]|uniref:Par3_HAL_N_term domain-containing protein n=1 Tax=Hymenolepis diminuta TaxID=6216 RepID=A0A0R3SR30_HYMDI|nr:unnamed protein product [Hymenolepis diminuta]VUZ55528.1 unnamed protein product [Hymenolepis diminuta]